MKRNWIQFWAAVFSAIMLASPVFAEADGTVFEDTAAAVAVCSSESEENLFGDGFASEDEAVIEEIDLFDSGDDLDDEDEEDNEDDERYPHSAHPYGYWKDQCWTYTEEGAAGLRITFSKYTYMEIGDYIYIYQGTDQTGQMVGKYKYEELAEKTITVEGDSVCIRLVSDGEETGYGFSITDIEAVSESEMEDCLGQIVDSGACGSDVYYELKGNGELRIYGSGPMFNGRITQGNVYSVVIDEGVSSIGESAFALCYALNHVEIPSSVTSIGEDAFMFCESLVSLDIPDGVTKIGENLFAYCTNLVSLTIPESVTSIGKSAFRECTGLCQIVIPNGVTTIGDMAFYNCDSLESITVPKAVKSIGVNAIPKYIKIIGYAGSEAQKYAAANGNPFEEIKADDVKLARVSGFTITKLHGREVMLTWKEVSGASKYRIEYSRNGDFSDAEVVTVSSKSALRKRIFFRRPGTYYIRIRAIKKLDSGKIRSGWVKKRIFVF